MVYKTNLHYPALQTGKYIQSKTLLNHSPSQIFSVAETQDPAVQFLAKS